MKTILLLAVVLFNLGLASEALAISPEMRELMEEHERLTAQSEQLKAAREALDQQNAPAVMVVQVVLLVVGVFLTVVWLILPFKVHAALKQLQAIRKLMEEDRLAAASQRAAQLAQLKVMAHALTGAQIDQGD